MIFKRVYMTLPAVVAPMVLQWIQRLCASRVHGNRRPGHSATIPHATLLSNGKVLLTGGISDYSANAPGLATAELYDP